MKVNFNKLQASLEKKQLKHCSPERESPCSTNDLETVISRIEERQVDITSTYDVWIKIGLALVNELGEGGRKAFHRISRFYPGYSTAECDKRYDQCLRVKNPRVTIKTIFHYAQQGGIDITCKGLESQPTSIISNTWATDQIRMLEKENRSQSTEEKEVDLELQHEWEVNTPTLPDEIYDHLPELLRESCQLFEAGTDRDVFLMGSLAVLSGCLPKLQGCYFDEFYTPHLFVFITAPACAGKGKMKWARYFGQGIHDQLVAQSQDEKAACELEMERYENLTRTDKQNMVKPQMSGRKMFYIPANISSSAFLQALADNNFKGVVFETEADTLTNSFKQEWGDFGDVLRKAFHHESTSLMRRLNKEYIEIKDPHLAMALSGTVGQVFSMMPTVDNGLFSRFLYYTFMDNSEFKHPFVSYSSENYTDFFNEKARVICDLYKTMNSMDRPLEFKLTKEQGNQFTASFNTLLSRGKLLIGRDFDANIKRLGLITFRIAMLLSGLRILETGKISNPMICNDLDYQTAMLLAITLEKHAVAIFQKMPRNHLNGKKLSFFDALPVQFDRQTYLKVASGLDIIEKTADKYVSQFKATLLEHEHNLYTKKRSA